ncbi:MAG: DNA polymerase III subunit alpha [Oligoflexales bacterium]|nr:DNA polymerase III subunit alpha [Oligoflexales bacterium]
MTNSIQPTTVAEQTINPSVFAHLHVHSEYSFVDGSLRIKELTSAAKALGHTHVALTDHGNMHGAVEFYLAAKEKGLTPILGCEIYHGGQELSLDVVGRGEKTEGKKAFQLVLLSKNTKGYQNLLKVVSQGYLGAQLSIVPITPEAILNERSGDLIALSTCLKGELSQLVQTLRELSGPARKLILDPHHAAAAPVLRALTHHIQVMKQRFGDGNFYVELTQNNLPEQKQHIPDLVEVARHFSLPLVASANAHYLNQDFADTHALAIAIKNHLTLADIRGRLKQAFFHLTSDEEMLHLFKDYPEALANTLKIAGECSHVKIDMGSYYLPKIKFDGEKSEDALRRLSHIGLQNRFQKNISPYYGNTWTEEKSTEYTQRLEFELDVIIKMGFADYFLIVQDFIGWAKEQGIPVGPGRGSGAGSLVAYALKITDLDPIPYTLIFERFLNPERVSLPDFDVDFCQWRREEVISYCIRKYGSQNVAQITTFGKMMAKAAVKSVGRAMNISFGRMDQFTKLFPTDLGITLKDALEQEPRIQEEMNKDDSLRECMKYALKLEGLTSHASVHAAGLVISDGEMTNYIPIYTTDGRSYITQFEMKPTEKVGLVKFDFLGLKTLTVIDKAVKLIQRRLRPDFNIESIPLSDSSVYKMLSEGHSCGIFQCESSGMTQLILKLKPSCFEDVIALVALFRPGPLGSGMVDDFVERKHGRQAVSYIHPKLQEILKDTYGMIVYQEQVQKIAAVLANYTLGEADLLRRAMGKKIPAEMAQQKERFVQGSLQNQIDQKIAEDIFDLMAEFANYGFNKSHSAAYGLVTYQTAYLKTYFPEEFLAASMTCDLHNTDKIVKYVEDCQRLGITVLRPDINESFCEFFVPEPKSVRFALTAIKGVGEASLTKLLAEREARGSFKSLMDLAHRTHLGHLGKKTLELLASVGALDGFPYSRKTLMDLIPGLVTYSQAYHDARSLGQKSLFDLSDDEAPSPSKKTLKNSDPPPVFIGATLLDGQRTWTIADLFLEKKLLGVFLTAHPLDLYSLDMKAFSTASIKDFAACLKARRPQQFREGDHNKRKSESRLKVTTVALLSELIHKRTKNGNMMVSLRLEQKGCSIEAQMFSDALGYQPLPPPESLVVVSGSLEDGFEGSIRFTLDKIHTLQDYRRALIKKISLTFCTEESQSLDEIDIKSLKERLLQEGGGTLVRFFVRHKNVQLNLSTPEWMTSLDDELCFYLHERKIKMTYELSS